MQQFKVPQLIDVESKIIGPITTRQFLIFVVAAIMMGLSYKLFDFALFLTVAIIIFAIAGTFAFLKVNGRPFHFFVLNFIQTAKKPNPRVWNHKLQAEEKGEIKNIKFEEIIPTKESFGHSRLAELSLIVDTQGKYQGDDDGIEDIQIEP